MDRRSRSLDAAIVATAALIVAGAVAVRSCAGPRSPELAEPASPAFSRAGTPAPSEPGATGWELPIPHRSTGWEEAAETVALDVRGLLLARPPAGAYAEARAEAARQDLILFPPEPSRLRRMLLGTDAHARLLALAALAARPEPSDDLVRIVLRSQRPDEDDDLVRLLGAELVAGLPPEVLARHEDDLLRAFEREPNPMILAVALPALERLEEPRLRALLESQVGIAAPEMLPVLVALARDRLGPAGLAEIGVLVRE